MGCCCEMHILSKGGEEFDRELGEGDLRCRPNRAPGNPAGSWGMHMAWERICFNLEFLDLYIPTWISNWR